MLQNVLTSYVWCQYRIQTYFRHTVFLKLMYGCFSDTATHSTMEVDDLKIFDIQKSPEKIFNSDVLVDYFIY